LQRLQAPTAIETILTRDYERACLWHGLWADARNEETRTVTAPTTPKGASPKMQVKKYTTLNAVLGLDERSGAATEQAPARRNRNTPHTAAERKADALLRDPAAMAAFLDNVTG